MVGGELAAKGLDLVVGRVIEGLVANDLLGKVVVVMLGQMGLEVGACQTGTDQQQLRGGLQLGNHLMEEVLVVLGAFVAGMGVVVGLMAIDVVLVGPAVGVKLMLVSMDVPLCTAARLAPLPRCARMTRPCAASVPARRASSSIRNAYDKP